MSSLAFPRREVPQKRRSQTESSFHSKHPQNLCGQHGGDRKLQHSLCVSTPIYKRSLTGKYNPFFFDCETTHMFAYHIVTDPWNEFAWIGTS